VVAAAVRQLRRQCLILLRLLLRQRQRLA
jgi:hypothetical protein